MMKRKTLSIIVPCYNEEATIGIVVEKLAHIAFEGWDKEVIVVDDGSTDASAQILRGISSGIKVITLERNSGKGTAVTKGIQAAKGDYCLIQDADLECDPADIPRLISLLDAHAGEKIVVLGSRELNPDNPKSFLLSRLGSLAITMLINILYRTKLTDTMMGYKLFPYSASEHFKIGGFESEMIFLLAMIEQGYVVIEAPVSYMPRDNQGGKKIKYRHGIKILLLIVSRWVKGTITQLRG